jgi:hypothetical protein
MSDENWYRARQLIPDAIIHCKHGINTTCECVTRFDVDKNVPLTKREIMIGTASSECNRMIRHSIHDDQKYDLLTQIIQCTEGEEDIHVKQYELLYPPLLPKNPIQNPNSNVRPLPPNHDQLYVIRISTIVLILLIRCIMLCSWIYCSH